LYYEWRDCCLNVQKEFYFMTEFVVNKDATVGGTSSEHKEGQSRRSSKLEAAVLSADSETTNNLIIGSRNYKTDTGCLFAILVCFCSHKCCMNIMKRTALQCMCNVCCCKKMYLFTSTLLYTLFLKYDGWHQSQNLRHYSHVCTANSRLFKRHVTFF